MPSMSLFGRKWLAGTDDMVFPSLVELFIRLIWTAVLGVATCRYYGPSFSCTSGGEVIRTYLVGKLVTLGIASCLLVAIMNRSAQGSIVDLHARRLVPPLLATKILLIVPEILLNTMGTVWAYMNIIVCDEHDHYTSTAIDVLVSLDWVLFGVAMFTLFMVIDPVNSLGIRRGSQPDLTMDSLHHRKLTRVWIRRFRWICCWIIRDKQSHEAFSQVASLFSSMFRDTDLIPSDIVAGLVLLRIKQKRESREQRRIELIAEQRLKYTSDLKEAFLGVPSWMSLQRAHFYMRLSMAAYACHLVMFLHCVTGVCKLLSHATCCACFRTKPTQVRGDNCCLCNLAGIKYLSKLKEKDILYASFKNHIFELPFYVAADHKYNSIVISVRGSWSLRDVFTDLTALPEKFDAPGLPPNSMAHKGMIMCASNLKKHLAENNILEKAFALYPTYNLVLTGHSLGAGTAVLLGIMLKPTYPDLKVFAFATPGGLLSRAAAEYTENFVMTVGVGDDCFMRLSIESFEDMRNQLFQVLSSCRLPKYRVFLNGFGYTLFGIPSRDLESTWKYDRPTPKLREQNHQKTALLPPHSDVMSRRCTKVKLFAAGKILHIAKKRKKDIKKREDEETYEMRWLQPEDFTDLRIMPRMLLDHFPHNVYKVITTVLEEQRIEIQDFTSITII